MLELDQVQWRDALERTCQERLITPVFQPIVDVVRGVACGYEALSRFTAPDAPSSPEEWFNAAMLHGYAGRLEAAVLARLLSSLRDLPPNAFMAVNVSPHAIVAPEVQEVLGDFGDLSRVVFEVTEQAPVEDYDRLVAQLDAMRKRGALVAVDDTGAGYASLSHLLVLRPEFVKLDRKLVTGLHEDARRAAAVSAIGAFAGALDAWLIAEGVEEYAELERLIELGVPLVQGYRCGRPDPEMLPLGEEQATWLRARGTARHINQLGALSKPAMSVSSAPDVIREVAVLVDEFQRPQRVFVPNERGRAVAYEALAVQAHDDLRSVALRAAARDQESRYAPICLCDDRARLAGVIHVSSLLEALARRD